MEKTARYGGGMKKKEEKKGTHDFTRYDFTLTRCLKVGGQKGFRIGADNFLNPLSRPLASRDPYNFELFASL